MKRESSSGFPNIGDCAHLARCATWRGAIPSASGGKTLTKQARVLPGKPT